jgi:hypothetical protein
LVFAAGSALREHAASTSNSSARFIAVDDRTVTSAREDGSALSASTPTIDDVMRV